VEAAAAAHTAATVEATAAHTAASAETAAAHTAAAAEAATAVAAATATTASATAGKGNRRRKHANRGSCDERYDRFAQHDCTP
jgi:hypothetical protein